MSSPGQPDDIGAYVEYLKSTDAGKKDPGMVAEYEKYLRSQPGMTDAQPERADLYPGKDSDRIKMSFADPTHQTADLQRRGYKNPHQNASGDWVGQGPNGHWYGDQTNFFRNKPGAEGMIPEHPLNWAEANIPSGIKNALWLGGGIAGDAAGGFVGPLAVPGAVTGAAAGNALGEKANQMIGDHLDVYGPKSGEGKVGQAALEGGAQELLGKAATGALGMVGKYRLPEKLGGTTLAEGARRAAMALPAAASYLNQLGQTPYKDILTTMAAPKAVSAAGGHGFGLKLASEMEDSLGAQSKQQRGAIQVAQDAFRQKFGMQKVNTQPTTDQALDWLIRNEPNRLGHSRVSMPEINEILGDVADVEKSNAGELLTHAQEMGDSVPGKSYEGSVTQRSDITANQRKRMAGNIKQELHAISPELGAADGKFSGFMNEAKTLRPVEGENAEGAVNNIWNRDNTARQQAAQKLMPDIYNDKLIPLRAAQTWDAKGFVGDSARDIGARTVGAMGLGGAAGLAHSQQHDELAIPLGIAAAMTNPKANYWASQMMGRTLQDHAGSIAARKLTPKNTWSLMNNQEKN